MLLVYTHKITPRLKYAFKQICTRILGIPVEFTTTVENFVSHDSLKMSYSKKPLGNEIFIAAHNLLFEQGLSDYTIIVSDWEDTKCFFETNPNSFLPFDIFAASFYLLSRYEEYMPHVKNRYDDYKMENSLAFREGFLKQPVVDIWAQKFKTLLISNYPDYMIPKKKCSVQPVLDIPSAYFYKSKGTIRTIGATLRDVLEFKFSNIYMRFAVIFGFKKDPYDSFKYIINKQKHAAVKFLVFFLVGEYSTYDKGINNSNRKFKSLIKHVNDYCKVALRVSYLGISNGATLKSEKQILEEIVNRKVIASRNSFSKLNLPETYRSLIELEILDDYSMGYEDTFGYRAGTCTPFFFYDLDYEIQTPLRVHSYQVADRIFSVKMASHEKQRLLKNIMKPVKELGGEFIPVFRNYNFGTLPQWYDFKELFNQILDFNNDNE